MKHELIITLAILAVIVAVFAVIASMTKPNCPVGSSLRGTRDGWFCIVKPVT